MPKNDSSSSEPVKRNGIATTTCVRIGISAFRSTWRTHDAGVAGALRARGAHVVAARLLDEDGAVEAHVLADAGEQPDQHRQREEATRTPTAAGRSPRSGTSAAPSR